MASYGVRPGSSPGRAPFPSRRWFWTPKTAVAKAAEKVGAEKVQAKKPEPRKP